MSKVKVWDGFVRSFHWLLVIAIATLYFSAEEGMLELHFVAGFFTLALLATRLIWGLIGSKTAKLSSLLHSPVAALKSFTQANHNAGHGAAGSYMVLAFFVLLLVQLVSGLMTSDDILTDGPLVQYVSSDTVDFAGWLHRLNFDILFYAIVLHIVAIVAYRIAGKNLVKPMVTGYSEQVASTATVTKSPLLAFIIFAVCLLIVFTTWGKEPLSYLLN
ncbi:cytochrome b/b6 domain-containing protein [Pseudoalteromonas mariniglutinosa]|uniref:cytochrome b/b6 domain-containing protein n=1 Tax=Pseudoalteromonas mariniglutinosa TaxID=206042 RepID=UPI0038506A69